MPDTNLDSLKIATTDGLQVGGFKPATHLYINIPLAAASVDNWAFVSPRTLQIISIREIHSVVGGGSAAVRPRKVTDTSAPGAAASSTVKELTTAAFDLTTVINTTVVATLSATAADLQLAAGDKIGLDFSGTLTGLVGVMTIAVRPI